MHCKVVNIFHTSIGMIFILAFPGNTKPSFGMRLFKNEYEAWKVVGIGENRVDLKADEQYSIWDCKVETLDENIKTDLKAGDILQFQ